MCAAKITRPGSRMARERKSVRLQRPWKSFGRDAQRFWRPSSTGAVWRMVWDGIARFEKRVAPGFWSIARWSPWTPPLVCDAATVLRFHRNGAQPGARANDHGRHAACYLTSFRNETREPETFCRTQRAGHGRGSSSTLGGKARGNACLASKRAQAILGSRFDGGVMTTGIPVVLAFVARRF